MLLMLVTAANNSGHSTLTPSYAFGQPSLHMMLDMELHTRSARILHSIAALLVRDTEVVTVASIASAGQLEYLVVAQHEQGREHTDEGATMTGVSHWPKISALDGGNAGKLK
jgi:hypothetical protein